LVPLAPSGVGAFTKLGTPVTFKPAKAGAAGDTADQRHHMKKRAANPTEQKCPACNGTGFAVAEQPTQPSRRIYPPPCRKCGGKGRIKQAD
jgi:DnaJ-class molecular chaperone